MRLYILCEGQTEDRFVKEVLYPHLLHSDIYAMPIICATKKNVDGKYKGGVSKYSKIRKELEILCKSDPTSFVTTMFDYYKLPKDTPGKNASGDIYKIAQEIESSINADLGMPKNLLVNLVLHEFEGLLFSDVTVFLGKAKADNKAVMELERVKDSFPSPEHINDSDDTVPSKRIRRILPEYSKILDGIVIAKNIGLDKIAEECPHFKAWLEAIKTLA